MVSLAALLGTQAQDLLRRGKGRKKFQRAENQGVHSLGLHNLLCFADELVRSSESLRSIALAIHNLTSKYVFDSWVQTSQIPLSVAAGGNGRSGGILPHFPDITG